MRASLIAKSIIRKLRETDETDLHDWLTMTLDTLDEDLHIMLALAEEDDEQEEALCRELVARLLARIAEIRNARGVSGNVIPGPWNTSA